MPVFLPALWLFAIFVSDAIAAALGVVWIIGRILYMVGYTEATDKRGPGFGIQAGAMMILAWRDPSASFGASSTREAQCCAPAIAVCN